MSLNLNGQQKVAFFIMSLEPKISRELMDHLGNKEKNIIRRTISQIKKVNPSIFLEMWETFKYDVEHSKTCETSWPEIKSPTDTDPTILPKSKE